MCLETMSSRQEIRKTLGNVSREGMTVYKIVGIGEDGKYYPLCKNIGIPYGEGLCEADTSSNIVLYGSVMGSSYRAGFHFFMSKHTAIYTLRRVRKLWKEGDLNPRLFKGNGQYKIIECIVKKSWVTQLGLDEMVPYGAFDRRTVVAKKAIFPEN